MSTKATKKLSLAIMASALFIAVQAHASLFDITFSDGGADDGSGMLSANATVTIGGETTYNVVGGYFNVLAGELQGSYTLLPTPNILGTPYGPGTAYSPSGSFYYDNLAYNPNPPFLDMAGLLFSGNNNGLELNLFYGYPPYAPSLTAPYTMYANSGYNVDGVVTLSPAPVSASVTAVPEPTTILAGALLLLPFGSSALRILRRNGVA